ncbi:hypothetical protein Tco_1284477 [Tanacetum coccineum]
MVRLWWLWWPQPARPPPQRWRQAAERSEAPRGVAPPQPDTTWCGCGIDQRFLGGLRGVRPAWRSQTRPPILRPEYRRRQRIKPPRTRISLRGACGLELVVKRRRYGGGGAGGSNVPWWIIYGLEVRRPAAGGGMAAAGRWWCSRETRMRPRK